LYLTELTNITETSKAMSIPPSAQFMKDQDPSFHHGLPPPRYDQAMGQGKGIPDAAQPGIAPHRQQNGK
jgi:hypothetical protein